MLIGEAFPDGFIGGAPFGKVAGGGSGALGGGAPAAGGGSGGPFEGPAPCGLTGACGGPLGGAVLIGDGPLLMLLLLLAPFGGGGRGGAISFNDEMI